MPLIVIISPGSRLKIYLDLPTSFVMKNNYLERILTAQVYDVAIESPLELAANLSGRIHNQVLLKREDLQQVFSFKLRGAYNKMIKLSQLR